MTSCPAHTANTANTAHTAAGANVPAPSAAPTTVPSRQGWPVSDLHAAEYTFTVLTGADDPVLAIDAQTDLPEGLGLPAGRRSLRWWREWLLANRTSYDARNAIWAYVIGRARDAGGDWLIGAAGLAMPKLVRHARELAPQYRGDEADLDCDILTGFVSEIRRVDTTMPGADHRLTQAAWRAGSEQAEHLAGQAQPTPDADNAPSPKPPLLPYQHEDLLVARAVALGLLDRDDARAWVEVKLHHRPTGLVAEALGLSFDCLRMRLNAASSILQKALQDGYLSAPMVISPQARQRLERVKALRDAARKQRTGPAISTRMNAAMPAPAPAY